MKIKYWIESMRLRTLPLALANTLIGSGLAFYDGGFRWAIFVLAGLTTLLLQILSNMANDYGDFKNKKDTAERIGPRRMVHSGLITPSAMLVGIYIVAFLSVLSGTALIWLGTAGHGAMGPVMFGLLGVAAILAAIKYTVGENPYGYKAMGDIFVFLFFGLAGVLGTYFLHTVSFRWELILPASAIGLLSVGVLNLNNLRDYHSDKNTGKHTVVVLLGPQKARLYHATLLLGAFLLTIIFTLINDAGLWRWIFLLAFPLVFRNLKTVMLFSDHAALMPELKKLSVASLIFAILFTLGLLVG